VFIILHTDILSSITMLYGEYKMIPWLLLIMLSVGPFNENYNDENGVWLTIQMHGEAQCRQAANDVMRTMYIFRELNPNLHVEAICREDLRMVPYVEEEV